MASYVVNPSKKVAEILSQFLEFDPKQLQIGLWSGDLSISEVALKRDAFAPLLNPSKPSTGAHDDDATGLPPLHLKLVSGKVGQMRMQIPWKRLVWGQGDVRLYVSDVDIVLAYESSSDGTSTIGTPRSQWWNLDNNHMDDDTVEVENVSDEERERKQLWLQEAEKQQLQGLPIPASMDEFLKHDKKKDEPETLRENDKEAGRIDSYLRQMTSSIVWRFFAGLQASIRNVKVVIVQDGIEIGIIQHAMEIKAGAQAQPTVTTEATSMDVSDIINTNSASTSEDPGSFTTPPDDIDEYKSGYDDGEHVDKTIEMQGLGIFIREVPRLLPPAPLHLEFSHSINADDYVLRPATIMLTLTFFYPYPPDKQSKTKKKEITATPIAVGAASRTSTTDSVITSDTAKARRGKREKVVVESDINVPETTSKRLKKAIFSPDECNDNPATISQSQAVLYDKTEMNNSKHLKNVSGGFQSSRQHTSLLPLMSEIVESRSTSGAALRMNDVRSVMDGSRGTSISQERIALSKETTSSPRLELQVTLVELKTVYSSKHYQYSMTFFSALTRIRRGRPSETIKAQLANEPKEPVRSIMVETPMISRKESRLRVQPKTIDTGIRQSPGSLPQFTPKGRTPSVIPLPAPGLVRNVSLPIYPTRQLELKLNFVPKNGNEKKRRIVRSWWIYAYTNVLREVTERRRKRSSFLGYSFSFDWEKQRLMRKEYIDLYLRRSVEFASFTRRGRNDEEILKRIEDQLPVEQILLYRSIARALHVRGIHEMDNSVLCLHDGRYLQEIASMYRSHTKQTSANKKRNRFATKRYAKQSTGEFAVDELATQTVTNAFPSVSDPMTVEDLRQLSNMARRRREATATGAKRMPSTPVSDTDCNVTSFAQDDEVGQLKNVGFTSAPGLQHAGAGAVSAPFGRDADMTITVSKTGASSARTFQTATQTTTGTITKVAISSSAKKQYGLRFSLDFRLDRLELLVLKDETVPFSLERFQGGESHTFPDSQTQAHESRRGDLSLKDGEDSSDGISYLTDDGNFSEAGESTQKVVEEMETEPILSSTDFLTFGAPTGVLLDVTVVNLSVFCGGISGGPKKMAFTIGSVSILGKNSCQLLTAGSTSPTNIQETFSMQEINLVQRKKGTRGRLLSRIGGKEAVKAFLLLVEKDEHFLEVDLAKFVLSAEVEALSALQRFGDPTFVTFPMPIIAENELDIAREYLLRRSEGMHPLGFLAHIDCALRCHGIDVFIPSSEISVERSEKQVGSIIDARKKLKASVDLMEFYSGSLVEKVCISANEQHDGISRFSGAKSSGFVTVNEELMIDQGLKILDISNLYDQQRGITSGHAIINISGLRSSVELPSLEGIESMECFQLQQDHIDIEFFLTVSHDKDAALGHTDISIGVSPVMFMVSKNRLSLFSDIIQNMSDHVFPPQLPGKGITHCMEPPRLETLSRHIVGSVNLSIVGFGAAIVSDDDRSRELSLTEQEIIMEEAISDYLSFVACFDVHNRVDEPILIAAQVCVERLIGAGFDKQIASECAEFAHRQFLDDIDLVQNTQVQTMHEMSSSRWDENEATADFAFVESEKFATTEEDSLVDDADSAVEDNSEESLDIIETALQNAVEHTLSAYLHCLGRQPIMDTKVEMTASKGILVRATKLVYDSHLSAEIPSLVIKNGAGVRIVSFGSNEIGSAPTGNDPYSHIEQVDHRPENDFHDHGLRLSVFEQDSGSEFGQGGGPLSVLGSDSQHTVVRHRERLVDARLDKLNICICSKVLVDLMDGIGEMTSIAMPSGHKGESIAMAQTTPNRMKVETSVCGSAQELSVALFSDELNPFTILKICSMECSYGSEFTMEANQLFLLNLTPEGQYFPTAIQPLESGERSLMNSNNPILRLIFCATPTPWTRSSTLVAEIDGVQIILLSQYLSELTQFLLSEHHGIGRLLFDRKSSPLVDDNGNSPLPMMFRVRLSDSSLVLPRTGISTDMACVEFTTLDLSNSYHKESFKLADETGTLVKGDSFPFDNAFKKDDDNLTKGCEFYDCLETNGERLGPISSFQNDLLLRFNIVLNNATLFATLPPDKAKSGYVEGVKFLREHRVAGRASEQKSVYESIFLDADKDLHCPSPRVWESITDNAASLEVLVDFAPKLRVLITDYVTGIDTISSLDLNAKMSQFYLLLSVWYGNMQELPVVFPYSENEIRNRAIHPMPPANFPEYGSEEYVQWLLEIPGSFATEIVCHFASISMQCTFDPPGYFDVDPSSLRLLPRGKSDETAFSLSLKECMIHLTTDEQSITRMGCSASSFVIYDERKTAPFNEFVRVMSSTDFPNKTWVDLSFGLKLDGSDLEKGALSLPLQATVFMTPGWVLVNLGVEKLDVVMADFTPIWMLLSYFSEYFSSEAFGHPTFEAIAVKEKLKEKLANRAKCDAPHASIPGLNIDFRLWLFRPFLCIPSDMSKLDAPALRIKSDCGFWYQYKYFGSYSSQEMGSPDLSLQFSSQFQLPAVCRHVISARENIQDRVKRLIDGLSFGLRMDSNIVTNHVDYAFCMPIWRDHVDMPSTRCRVTSAELEVHPIPLPMPSVCSPITTIDTELGLSFCEITLVVEVLPQTSSMLLSLIGVGNEDAGDSMSEVGGDLTNAQEPSFTISARIECIRFFVIDPTLGVHLPLAVFSLSTLNIMASRLGNIVDTQMLTTRDSPPSDLQVIVETTFWADYFKLAVTRSWEPLIEPFKCLVLYEKSMHRGEGLTLTSDNPFHVNVTGALLLTLDDAMFSLTRAVSETFYGNGPEEKKIETELKKVKQDFIQEVGSGDQKREVDHQIPEPLHPDDRIAFSLLNLTGQRIRIHQLSQRLESDTTSLVTYLDHEETTRLDFQATVSMIQNLRLVEVPYPGLPNSRRDARVQVLGSHSVDVQLPGFKWLEGISVDSSGRRFDDIIPRSPIIQSKISKDWRLGNAMKLLSEVGLDNGGRLITVRSLFEVRNHTTHPISVYLHPDPTHKPQVSKSLNADLIKTSFTDGEPLLSPGDALQIPVLLLESALRLEGNHLGCLWVRPKKNMQNEGLFNLGKAFAVDSPTVAFSSRPVQLARIVHESALLFQSGNGVDLPPDKVRTGIQISCPISDGDGVPVAPFCYAIEIRRSPIVQSRLEQEPQPEKKVTFAVAGMGRLGSQMTPGEARRERKTKQSTAISHIPIAYTLVVHPPIVIENLLPAHGRFELMHATRRSVLWFSDLKPGEKVSVHTVGLDAPLLLLVNLGFCRTPVGEGALVHHGSDVKGSTTQGGLKSIGKAVTMGTKQIGKTLTSMSDSPDSRGKGKVFLLQNPQYHRGPAKRYKNDSNMAVGVGRLGLDNDFVGPDANKGHVHLIDGRVYNADEIATETVVVDGIGQKLTLKIENVRGGGGQRRISLFCPFWIVNTTEHALRYKQEKSKNYVSGTVCSPSCDGSRSVDEIKTVVQKQKFRRLRRLQRHSGTTSKVHSDSYDINQDTVFSGTPGALASYPGRPSVSRERLAKLLEEPLQLQDLASIAFMFNFHEDALLIGHQRLVVQLADGTGQSPYCSDWSQGLSLESIGVPQVVGMHCKDGRVLELSVTISVAPGFLSGYTKVVRFTPRYILVNRLNQPIRIWQDSSLLHSYLEDRATQDATTRKEVQKWHYENERNMEKVNKYEMLFGRPAAIEETLYNGVPLGTTAHKLALYIGTIGPNELVPFHLPDTRGDRQFRIDLGGNWNLSPSFDADVTGDYTLRIRKALDLRLLRHVNTRASPHYKVELPPLDGSEWDGELGVWFETSWGGARKILVKGTKRGRYAFNNTDIRVGDELLEVDNTSVAQLTFSETMKLLKERLAYVSVARRSEVAQSQRGRASLLHWKQRKLSRLESFRDFGSSSDLVDDDNAQVVLTFRTLEERLRRVRVKAARTKQTQRHLGNAPTERNTKFHHAEREITEIDDTRESFQPDLKVEMRAIHNSIFVVVREQNPFNPPYRIENRAINHFVVFRQRGCLSYPWNILQPGESAVYCWEEPMKSRKLTVRVGSIDVHLHGDGSRHQLGQKELHRATDTGDNRAARSARSKQFLSFHNVDGEDQANFGAAISVKLEEIGFECELPCPQRNSENDSEMTLNCSVDSNGATRVLVISNSKDDTEDKSVLQHHINALHRCISEEENRVAALQNLRSSIRLRLRLLAEEKREMRLGNSDFVESIGGRSGASSTDVSLMQIETEATAIADFPEDSTIWRRNQIVIEVLEAAGLSTSDVTSKCNPYCEVFLKGSKRSKSLFSSATTTRKTYFIEGSYSPKWIDQTFVFDVPSEAVRYTREHTLQIRIREFRFIGQHPFLGQTNVYLQSLRNQRELVGWYPLVGRMGRRDLEDSQANWGRGSIKLRLQWIYTVPALVNYFLMLSENRLCDLQRSLDGMKGQLNNLMESEARRNRLKNHEITKDILKDPFGVASRLLAQRRGQVHPVPPQQRGKVQKKKGDVTWPLLEPMKNSRNGLLWLFHFQTQESRRARKASSHSEQNESVPLSIETRKTGVNSAGDAQPMEGRNVGLEVHRRSVFGPASLMPLDENSIPEFTGESGADIALDQISFGKDLPSNIRPQRQRSLSLEDIKRSIEVLELKKRGGPLQISDTTGLLEFGQISVRNGSIIMPSAIENDEERLISVDELLKRGFVYHVGRSNFHRYHLTYHFRLAFIEGAVSSDMRPKSRQRLSISAGRFKTWLVASAVCNDAALATRVSNNKFEFSLNTPKRRLSFAEKLLPSDSSHEVCRTLVLNKIGFPGNAPIGMSRRLQRRAEGIHATRMSFERTCKRSLAAILNPGGWLIVRPFTVLNVPLSYPGMSVKIRYGSLTLSTNTVDSRVTPTWVTERSADDIRRVTKRSKASQDSPQALQCDGSLQTTYPPKLDFENDLSIPIDPQKTSGSIRLVVVGERLNTKVELGILDIPIGAAIRCCVEGIENDFDSKTWTQSEYVRWFPLMDPKGDTIGVEGDLGYGGRPKDTENMTNTHFSQYFSPCIKLALIWRSRETEDTSGAAEPGEDLREGMQQAPPVPLTTTYFTADIARISAALIDSQRAEELLALSVSNIEIRYFVTKAKTRLGCVVGWIQIDHQVDGTKEPVVLAPTPVMHPSPTLQFLLYRDNLRSKGKIDSYELIAFYMEEMDLTIEESWVLELWEFFVSIVRKRVVKKRALDFQSAKFLADKSELIKSMKFMTADDDTHQSLLQQLWENDTSEAKTYIEKLYLGPIRVNLTYFKGKRTNPWDITNAGSYLLDGIDGLPDVFSAARHGADRAADHSEIFAKWTEFTHDEDLWTEMGQGKNLPNILAAVLPSVSEAPIRLQGKGITFIFENKSEIFNSLKNYYVNETLKQIYKIVGSLDFVGNPTMVLNSLATGVRDFFVAPSQAFLKSPKNPSRVGLGVAKGTLSLFAHSTSGLFGFLAKMSATAGQAATMLSFDNDYQQWHRDDILAEAKNLDRHWKRRGVGGASRIVTRPIVDLIRGVILGTSGVILSPIKGARKDGPTGLIHGVAVGAAGVLVKPVVGILDALSHFTGSIHDAAKSVNVLDRRYEPAKRLRLPYTFSVRNVLIPFNPTTARSVVLLKKFPISNSVAFQSEMKSSVSVVEAHVASEILSMEPGVETFIIVTTLRVVLVNVKRDSVGSHTPSLCWEVPLIASAKVSSRISDQGHNGVALTITACLSVSKWTAAQWLYRPTPKKTVNTPPKTTAEQTGGDNSSFYSTASKEDFASPQARVLPMTDMASGLPGAAFIRGESSLDDDASMDEGPMHTAAPPTGDLMDYFTVIAEFHHRKQLSRLHNAICCITGHIDDIILDRGIGNGGSDGYTSFGEFFFTNTEAMNKGNPDGRTEVLEFVPWVPKIFFDLLSQHKDVDENKEFSKMRRIWTLDKEVEASQELGGPNWLVKARADAIFVAEQAPEIPDHMAHTHAIHLILLKLYDGSISYEEAALEVERAIEQIEKALAEEKQALGENRDSNTENALRLAWHDHKVSPSRGRYSSDRSDISDVFMSAVGSMSPRNESPSSLSFRENIGNFEPSIALQSNEDPLACGKVDEHVDDAALRGQLFDQETHNGTDTTKESPSFSTSVVTDGNSEWPGQIAENNEPSLHLHSRSARTVTQLPSSSDPRMDRLEIMLEKLLQISLVNASQQASTPGKQTENGKVAAVHKEVSRLRKEIKEQRNREDERVGRLRDEVAELKDQLRQLETIPQIGKQTDVVPNRAVQIGSNFCSDLLTSTKTKSSKVKNLREKVSLLFRRGGTDINVEAGPILNEGDASAQFVDGLIDLEDLEVDGDDIADRIISKPRFDISVSDLEDPQG